LNAISNTEEYADEGKEMYQEDDILPSFINLNLNFDDEGTDEDKVIDPSELSHVTAEATSTTPLSSKSKNVNNNMDAPVTQVEEARAFMAVQPFIEIGSRCAAHRCNKYTTTPHPFFGNDKTLIMMKLKAFVVKVLSFSTCYNHSAKHLTHCECIQGGVDSERCAEWIFTIATQPKGIQQTIIKEFINGRDNIYYGYKVRLGNNKKAGYNVPFCCNTFCALLHLNKRRWKRLSGNRFIPGPIYHSNLGNDHKKMNK
jgi:hypothetical protein